MTKRLVALLGAAVIVLAACQPGTPTTGPAGSGGTGASQGAGESGGAAGGLAADQTIKLYLSDTDPATMDPQAAQDSVSIAVIDATERGLLYYDKDLNLVPALAEALPEVSADGKTLTFKLRSGLKYDNGDPIVAGDFVNSAKRLLDPRLANPYAYIACDLAGAEALLGAGLGCGSGATPTDDTKIDSLLEKTGVTAPDDSTVVVTLKQAATYFGSIMAMWVFTPHPESWTSYAEAGDLVSSGPFKVDTWDHNAEIDLVPNPSWDGSAGTKPTLTKVQYLIGGDPEAALASYEQGQLDTVVVPGTSVRRVADDPNLKDQIQDLPQQAITYYDYANCQAGDAKCPKESGTSDGKSATANKNFRIALTQAVNKQQFIDLTFGGLGQVANGMVMPGIPGYDADYNPYPYDVTAAQAAMTKALQELGTTDTNGDGAVTAADLGVLKFGYNCNAGHLPRVAFLAEAWRTGLGFAETSFDISCTDFPTFLQERPAGKYNISRDGWGADFPHAKNQLDLLVCGSGNNNSQYCNPAFDAAFNAAATIADPAQQTAKYIEAQRIAVDDASVLFLRYGVTRYLVQPYVGGLTPTSSDHQNIGDVFLETIQIKEH
jgi:ABC-type oligopeptide transport system substrate-binding subunit